MNVIRQENCFLLQKESHTIARCTIQPGPGGILLTALSVDPCWQRRGYGSYLLKEVLRSTGGFVPGQASLHWLYATDAPAAFFARFGFVLKGDRLVRRRPEELTAVKFAQSILAGRIPAGGFAIDATCGNGHDTEFLCRTVGPAGRVLALDIQPAAIASTRARLEQGRFKIFRCIAPIIPGWPSWPPPKVPTPFFSTLAGCPGQTTACIPTRAARSPRWKPHWAF